ncbi:MAG: nickel pincer cofactor biosynthesis protein LarB [Clostridiales bacterium]|nr:nickel pincer cofactor biosynthesis protein LarB [Clostridiales bacterium]
MEQTEIYRLLQQVAEGTRTPDEAMADIRMQPDLLVGNYADIDLHRNIRQGMPEVIYGEGKTAEQIAGIICAMAGRDVNNIMVTRLSEEKMEQVKTALEQVQTAEQTVKEESRKISFTYDPTSRIGIANREETEKIGKIAVVAAGTSDLPVAEEAAVTAELYGSYVERVYDVGVAGLHRLLHRLPVLEDANVIIAVAGMEGALVSVVGGLVACPVIGVPTSVGYGANFGGAAALLSMLNSCASGVSVVNIDNGFGAGVLAARINRQSVGHMSD